MPSAGEGLLRSNKARCLDVMLADYEEHLPQRRRQLLRLDFVLGCESGEVVL